MKINSKQLLLRRKFCPSKQETDDFEEIMSNEYLMSERLSIIFMNKV